MFGLFAGNYQKALEKYKVIHRKFPENVECKLFHWVVQLSKETYYIEYVC